ncbi:molybdopterin molybdotransferase MoeA [Desulfoplanes formicivorans]|uniref:Molybdopterin molybdenumtransferase n=1 Tax=Desulfoplanes formicivorans TaxID=1592317 RepID=A0A194AJ81_9BACT|nr:gephyrin-like molybdotransferase Glp [Desulfoplanes formicivorans]GAU08809.1 molybdopterin biosynthesis protein MoeA [Desulfoplanes formicivorans]
MKQDFFRVISSRELCRLLKTFPTVAREQIDFRTGVDRMLATAITSPENLPMVHRSSMDGFAVHAEDTFGASEANPAYLENKAELKIDELSTAPLERGECMSITTGGTLPPGGNAVVMVEHTQELGAGTIEIRKSVAPGDNVMLAGEDVAQGAPILPRGKRLRPQEIGLLAALGITSITVFKRVRAGIISTGDELVDVNTTPRPGQVRDVNTSTLACLLGKANAHVQAYGLVKDDLASIVAMLKQGLAENDVLFISGGSSVGTRDLTIEAILSLPDSEILAHGVSVSPGKPTILARVGGKPIMGLPGQVTSAQVIMLVFGCPLIHHLGGSTQAWDTSLRPQIPATLATNVSSKQGREDYVRVELKQATPQEPLQAVPRTGKSGLLKTLVQCDGLVRIPAESEGLLAGTKVMVWKI